MKNESLFLLQKFIGRKKTRSNAYCNIIHNSYLSVRWCRVYRPTVVLQRAFNEPKLFYGF